MYDLPEPPATFTVGQAARDAAINAAADEMMAALNAAIAREKQQTRYDDPDLPSHKDGPQIGTTPPVAQPDSRIVPAWALGVVVGSIGVGAGSIGLGCAVWLACKGLSSVIHSLSTVTLAGVLTVAIPFAGLAAVATAIGGAISKAKRAVVSDVHHHNGPEYHEHHTDNRRSLWQKNIHPK